MTLHLRAHMAVNDLCISNKYDRSIDTQRSFLCLLCLFAIAFSSVTHALSVWSHSYLVSHRLAHSLSV